MKRRLGFETALRLRRALLPRGNAEILHVFKRVPCIGLDIENWRAVPRVESGNNEHVPASLNERHRAHADGILALRDGRREDPAKSDAPRRVGREGLERPSVSQPYAVHPEEYNDMRVLLDTVQRLSEFFTQYDF